MLMEAPTADNSLRGSTHRDPLSGLVTTRLLRWFERCSVAALSGLVLLSVVVLVRSASRGLDLTDEGIYLQNHRYWRNPELTFTGASMMLGPLFQLLGWDITSLRIAKLIMVVLSAGFLGHAAAQFLFHHVAPSFRTVERHAVVVLSAVLGGFSIYAWLPQSPGYNDLAIILSTVIVGLVLLWAILGGRRAWLLGAGTGMSAVALAFVKWPSAVMVSAGVGAFILLSGRTRRMPSFVASALCGAVLITGVFQIMAGPLTDRVSNLVGGADTVLEGVGFTDSYLKPYMTTMARTLWRSFGLVAPAIAPALGLAVLVGRRSRVGAGVIYALGLTLLVVSLRLRGHLTGGEINVIPLESTFPALFLAVLGIVALTWILGRSTQAVRFGQVPWASASESPHVGATDVGSRAQQPSRWSLPSGVALLAGMPLLQAIGTGNPPFRIAFCAGASWGAAMALIAMACAARGGVALLVPAAFVVASVASVGVVAGVDGMWTDSYRVGPLSMQTEAVPVSPTMGGITVDPSNASLITQVYRLLEERGKLDTPTFSSANGTGLTYALGLRHPPAGLFLEEPLPGIVRSRIREACRINALGPGDPPVVLSVGTDFPTVTAEELRRCGISFPSGYESVVVKPDPPGYTSFRRDGVTVWLPVGDR